MQRSEDACNRLVMRFCVTHEELSMHMDSNLENILYPAKKKVCC